LGLPVYHILEDVVRQQTDPALYEAEVGLMEITLDKDSITAGLDRVRSAP
jgi:betaine reductase